MKKMASTNKKLVTSKNSNSKGSVKSNASSVDRVGYSRGSTPKKHK